MTKFCPTVLYEDLRESNKKVVTELVPDGIYKWKYGDPQSSYVPYVTPFVNVSFTRSTDGNGLAAENNPLDPRYELRKIP